MRPILLKRKTQEALWGYFFLVPALIFFALFLIYPMIDTFITSVFVKSGSQISFAGMKNYETLFADPIFLKNLVNTFRYVLVIVPSVLLLSILCAYLIGGFKSQAAQSFFRGVFYIPTVVSVVSVSMVWTTLYNYNYGIINYLLSLIGIEGPNWLGNASTVIPAVSAVVIYKGLGQPIILFVAAMSAVPESLYEAATVDGVSKWKQFLHITLPLIVPTTLYVAITTTISSFQIFAFINLMTGGGPNYASSTLLYMVYKTAFTFGDFHLASAIAVVLFFCALVFSVLQFKFFNNSIEY